MNLQVSIKSTDDVIPRRIIISRKGWDAGVGCRPSPIFDDESMLSFPIPEGSTSRTNYSDILIWSFVGVFGGRSYAGEDSSGSRGTLGLRPKPSGALYETCRLETFFGSSGRCSNSLDEEPSPSG
jgi:hypothetical protein